jgi:hypothetical protein
MGSEIAVNQLKNIALEKIESEGNCPANHFSGVDSEGRPYHPHSFPQGDGVPWSNFGYRD